MDASGTTGADGAQDNPEEEVKPAGPSFGECLQASRERNGMSLQDCAQALRLPIRLLHKLETDDYQGIDYSVYLRGYLRKYAAHVRLDEALVEAQLESLQPKQPELVAPQPVSVWRRGFHRYSSAVTYIVLTAIIVAPLIWLGLNGVLKRNIARLAPLNATPVNAQSSELVKPSPMTASTNPTDTRGQDPAPADPPSPKAGQKPLMASIAPFSAMEQAGQHPSTPPPATAPATTVQTDKTHLTVSLQQPSWVEITDTQGRHLEYALLPAGTHKSYASNQDLNVRIGNAGGAEIDVDGKPLLLDPFRKANVAHFDIGNNGSIQPDNS